MLQHPCPIVIPGKSTHNPCKVVNPIPESCEAFLWCCGGRYTAMARNVVIKSWPLLCHLQGTRGFSLISQSIWTSTSTKFAVYS